MVLPKRMSLFTFESIDERSKINGEIGVDYLIVQPITKSFLGYPLTQFVGIILVNDLKTKKIIIGYDHRY